MATVTFVFDDLTVTTTVYTHDGEAVDVVAEASANVRETLGMKWQPSEWASQIIVGDDDDEVFIDPWGGE